MSPLAAVVSLSLAGSAVVASAVVPDRTAVTKFLTPSSMDLKDMNGDCGISDTDVAMIVHDRLIAIYGSVYNCPDSNANGVVDQGDLILAITGVLKASFGKVNADDAPVSLDDASLIAGAVLSAAPEGDVNCDGLLTGADVMVAIENLGSTFDTTIEQLAGQLFEYIGAFEQFGRDRFMASACAPAGHQPGISDTWPVLQPRWWQPNHQTAVSRSLDPEPAQHDVGRSIHMNYPPTHETTVSQRWPANHVQVASASWRPPSYPDWPTHGILASWRGDPPPAPPPRAHREDLSLTFPAGHVWAASSTWPTTHDQVVSRAWWSGHTQSDSRSLVVPPMHATDLSDRWVHSLSVSASVWPPNHSDLVSDGWGNRHDGRLSVSYPPNHGAYASGTWPGPRPNWPPTHVGSSSDAWAEPAPGGPSDWPLFPPGHNWFSTFRDTVSPIVPRVPWPNR